MTDYPIYAAWCARHDIKPMAADLWYRATTANNV